MDIVVTVPMPLWQEWLAEGDLPGQPWSGHASHFWIPRAPLPEIAPGERVYIVAHGHLRGYAPLVELEPTCRIRPDRACLLRTGEAVALTTPEPIRGFRGWQYRWWAHNYERPFPGWREP